ncbi:CCA tRNA nucleotidyltransferase [Paenibacillus sp. FA6]|uniref:CCA tRNA nucleotidyltransferase n=1 Tax=Paenibacillus sp. FA6 TaxID=3413029 RepID=UPI003F65789C
MKWIHAEIGMAEQSEVLLQTLLEHGFEAYWVGGCVRDELMGRPIHDMDLTTSATPEEVMGLFDHTIPTGIQHGTVTVIMKGHPFEVTTYRVEGTYINHRRPDAVTFVKDIKEDLKRRDFTMNAIARAVDGTYIDPFGGQEATRKGIIRAVGDPLERFDEDALRMVRCVRFASVFGYSIAKDTWKGLLSKRSNLQYIALERIRVEMEKIMRGENPLRGLELLSRSLLLEFAKVPILCSRFDRELLTGLHILSSETCNVRWGLLLYAGNFTSSEAGTNLRKWTFSNQEKDDICGLLRLDEQVRKEYVARESVDCDERLRQSWISLVLSFGVATADGWLMMQRVLPEHRRIIPVQVLDLFATWGSQMRVHHLKGLNVSGDEIMQALKRPAGPWLSEMLQHLLLVVAAGIVENDKDSLIDEMKRVSTSHG